MANGRGSRRSPTLTRRALLASAALAPLLAAGAALAQPGAAPPESRDWPTDILDWRTSPVDLSFLNAGERPAGRRGFVRTEGEALVFADGTPARFWGTNLSAYALFGTPAAEIKQQARRLSQLGFNLVRLHHHDSIWVVPNIFGGRDASDTQRLDPAAMEKLDAWIAALKDEGIYVWLDLHVGRQLKAGDGITAFDEIRKGKPVADLRGFNYVNDSIRLAMRRFNEAYVNHVNRYTGVAYKDEPAIMAMLVTNENDLTHHFGNALLPNGNVPSHNAIYMREAAAFAKAHGLPENLTWRSWEHGPSKLFLNDLEHRFHSRMIGHLREQGVRVPIVPTSQWGYNPVSSLPALTAGQFIDNHSYGDVGELAKNPIHVPTFVHWIAAGRIAGMPVSVTEWNVGTHPAPDRHAAPLYMAASAAHQGWAAMMQYAYSQVPLDGPRDASPWHAFNDPSLIATLPAAALMFRRGDVQQAKTTYVFAPSRETLYYRAVTPVNAVGLRTAAERGKLVVALPGTPELPWLAPTPLPAEAQIVDPDRAVILPDAQSVESDTGELRRNWVQPLYLISTSRTQAASGRLGGRTVTLPDVELRLTTAAASVVVQSLDGQPLALARQVLISLGARSVLDASGKLPYRSEPVQGELFVRGPAGLKLFAHQHASSPRREIPITYTGGRYAIRLDGAVRSYWLILERGA